MVQADYDACETRLLVHEGGKYTDGKHPFDPGGPTRWGCTITDARLYWKHDATPDDVRTMPLEVAKDKVIRPKYWLHSNVRGDILTAGVDDCVFDYAYNSGVGRAGRVLRHICGLPGSSALIDDQVMAELAKRDPKAVINAICDERMRFLQGLAIWPTYKNGWTTRVHEVRGFSCQLADAAKSAAPMPSPPPENPEVQSAGKGTIPVPATRVIAAKHGGKVSMAAGAVVHWIGEHPLYTAAAIVGVGAGVGYLIHEIDRAHLAHQTTPMPNTPVVPVLAAA